MYKVTFHFEDGSPSATYDIAPGESLLDIAMDHDINLHHNCGGVCACEYLPCHTYNKAWTMYRRSAIKKKILLTGTNNPRLNSGWPANVL